MDNKLCSWVFIGARHERILPGISMLYYYKVSDGNTLRNGRVWGANWDARGGPWHRWPGWGPAWHGRTPNLVHNLSVCLDVPCLLLRWCPCFAHISPGCGFCLEHLQGKMYPLFQPGGGGSICVRVCISADWANSVCCLIQIMLQN